MKKILAAVFLSAVCAFSLAYYLGKHREPSDRGRDDRAGWDQAQGEMRDAFKKQLGASFEGDAVAVPPAVLQSVAECMAGRATAFLDRVGCDIRYRPSETSEAQHLQKQAKCLRQSGYEDALKRFTLHCLRRGLPDDWAMAVPAIEKAFAEKLVAAGTSIAEADVQSACYARMASVALTESDCPLIDRNASRVEDLIKGPEDCGQQTKMKSELVRFMRVCTKGKYPPQADSSKSGAGEDKASKPVQAPDLSASVQGIVPLAGDQCPLDYHRRDRLCLHSRMLSLKPPVLESIIRSYRVGGPAPMVREK